MVKLWGHGGRRAWAILAAASLLATLVVSAPAVAGSETYEYRFEFQNGQVLEGVSDEKNALLTEAGGAFVDAPSGMIVHLSCSDKFPGGWGEKEGPDPVADSAWQIATYEISKIKNGKVDKTCSNVIDGDIPTDGKVHAYKFEFVNGQTVEGFSPDKDGFIPDAGGTDPNNPTGMTVHLSCSDDFPGGWGEKDGPDPVADSAWQILRYEISEYKDGELKKTCSGGLPEPPPPPPSPAIDLEKFVNGEDADNPTGPEVNVGDTVVLSYTVVNTGNVTLFDVELNDFDLGPILCPLDTLAVGEAMDCSEAEVLVETAGQKFMEAKVTANANVGGTPAPRPTDPDAKTKAFAFTFVNGNVSTGFSDDNTAFLPDAGGTDANNPTGMEVHVSCSDDFPGGWGEKDGPNQVTDSAWQIASYSIIKWDKGEIKKECGETFTDVTQMVMDDDPVYFIAIEPSNPAIDIEKTVNGIDADNPPGPEFQVGDKVTIEYVVTNTGDVKLSNIVVTDSDLGVRNCELTMLEVGESMSCDMFMETLTEPGAVFMKATVTGDGPDGTEVMDMDPIHFTVVETLPPPEECSVELLPISVGEGLVQVSWSPVDGAVEYIVRRDGMNVGVTSDTSLIDGPIPPNRTFTYKVQSVAADGTRSDKAFCGRVIYIPAD